MELDPRNLAISDPPQSSGVEDIESFPASPPRSPIEAYIDSNQMETDDSTTLPREIFGGSSQRR